MKIYNNKPLLLFLLCFVLVLFRVVKSEQLGFVFLFWNLFLAFVPLWLSSYLIKNPKIKHFKLYLLCVLWILFLPNAPYIVTDLFHLHKRAYLPVWYDLVLIFSFSITGLYLFFLSVQQIIELVKVKFPALHKPFYLTVLFLAVSYGVYIGRFLRVNSWDVIHPFWLAKTCLKPFFNLSGLKDVCCFTFIFSMFLLFLFFVFKPQSKKVF